MFHKLQKNIDIHIAKNEKENSMVIKHSWKNYLTNNTCAVLTKLLLLLNQILL